MRTASLRDIDDESLRQLTDRLAEGVPAGSLMGLAVWITGLSGAGKTTVARLLMPRFQEASRPCVLLDGDAVRSLLRHEWKMEVGHGREERVQLARLYGRLCRALTMGGYDVVCATISMFHEIRDWNRTHVPNYLEVYLRVPLDELRRRDPKGLYARPVVGEEEGMVGIGVPAEEPRTPDLVIDHDERQTSDQTASIIWDEICKRR